MSDKYTKELTRLLNASGATLVRQRKHQVWKLPNGKNLVIASTPSDCRSPRLALAELRRLMVAVPASPLPLPGVPAMEAAPGSRMAVPNRPARPRIDVVELPALGTSAPLAELIEQPASVPLLDLIGMRPAFWALGPGGRVRVLAKLLLQPGRRVEIVGEIFCRVRRDELQALSASPSEMNVRMSATTDDKYYPALLIHQAGHPHLFVDVYAKRLLGAADELIPVVIPADADFSVRHGMTLSTSLADETHDCVMFGIFQRADLKRGRVMVVDEGWTNHAIARAAVNEIWETYDRSGNRAVEGEKENSHGH